MLSFRRVIIEASRPSGLQSWPMGKQKSPWKSPRSPHKRLRVLAPSDRPRQGTCLDAMEGGNSHVISRKIVVILLPYSNPQIEELEAWKAWGKHSLWHPRTKWNRQQLHQGRAYGHPILSPQWILSKSTLVPHFISWWSQSSRLHVRSQEGTVAEDVGNDLRWRYTPYTQQWRRQHKTFNTP